MKPNTRVTPGLSATTLEPPNRLYGYAAKFNEPSAILYDESVCKGPFVEVIAPGAFAKSLRDNPDVRALYNHQAGAILARTKAGTLSLVEDEVGLKFDLTLPDTTVGRDLRENVRNGNIDGCSFGFFVVEDSIELRPGKPAIRTLLEVHCYEITPGTAFPAYESTEVALRSKSQSLAPVVAPTPRPLLSLSAARLRLSRD
jgi:HK97 family phage prohead protease